MIVRYNTITPFLRTGQKLLLVIIDGCLATGQNGFICYTWYYKTSPWQLDFPDVHTIMALPERHTDVSIRGFIDFFSNTKVYKNHYFIF